MDAIIIVFFFISKKVAVLSHYILTYHYEVDVFLRNIRESEVVIVSSIFVNLSCKNVKHK